MSHNDLHRFQLDLIENDSFVRWVRSEFRDDDNKWSAFIDQHLDRTDEINEAIRWVRDLRFADDSRIDRDRLWKRISTSSATVSASPDRSFGRLRIGYIAAALAAACLLFFFVARNSFDAIRQVESGPAQELAENLPDGSKVRLDAETTIKYSKKGWENKRQLELKGLAFFEVKKGSDFVVHTPEGKVTVLGTSFSVESRHGSFAVICRTGRVEVQNTAGTAVVLGPGDKAFLESGTLKSSFARDGAQNNITWLEGTYTFEAVPLSMVTAEIQRQFGVKVEMPDDASGLTYTGFFRTNDLDGAMQSVTWPLKLKYRVEGSKVYVTH